MAAAGSASPGAPTGGPAVRVGRRFLPVAAAELPFPLAGGTVQLPVAPGTPVHAIAAGRVVGAEGAAVGEVVLRIDGEIRLVHRGLLPSSVSVQRGEAVAAGDLLGVVARAPGEGVATLELVASRADGSAVDVVDLVVGAADPLELFLAPPPGVLDDLRREATRRAPRTSRPPSRSARVASGSDSRAGSGATSRLVSRRRAGTRSTSSASEPHQPAAEQVRPTAEAEVGPQAGDRGRAVAVGRGDPHEPAAEGPPTAEPEVAPEPEAPPSAAAAEGEARATQASRLAARRRRPGRG